MDYKNKQTPDYFPVPQKASKGETPDSFVTKASKRERTKKRIPTLIPPVRFIQELLFKS